MNLKSNIDWFNSKSWLNGLVLKPHDSIDPNEFEMQYHKNKLFWDKAFEFLKNTDLSNIADGKIPIINDQVYASVNHYLPKEISLAKWEAHRKYADIQYIIEGLEKIGLVNLAETTVIEPYDENKDIVFLNADGGQYYLAEPGSFFIFFPNDAHRPSIKTGDCNHVKKIVIKVLVN
jgi:YhcH/YjgK/YiaL family protein